MDLPVSGKNADRVVIKLLGSQTPAQPPGQTPGQEPTLSAALFARMGYGYSSEHKYVVRKAENPDRVSITLEKVQLRSPYVKVWPCPDEFVEDQNEAVKLGMSLGAYISGVLVGVAVTRPRTWNKTLWLENIHIDETCRGLGIGTLLVQGIEDIARQNGFRIIGLEVQNTNAPAIDFYRKIGFVVDGLDISYYTNNAMLDDEVAIFMKKPLG